MSEHNKKVSTMTKVKKHIRGKPYFIILCLLFFFSITSLLFEIFGGNSVTSTIMTLLEKCSFFQKHFSLLLNIFHRNVPEILRANVVLEIVKILGFGSVLIGIVQMLMDKKTFGVSYANIIKCRYPFYRQTFFIHLLATIMCIGFSAAGASEGALITLIIMLLGFLYLWLIIDDLVFRTANRESAAIEILEDAFGKSDNKDALNIVQSIAREAAKEENVEKSNIIECFARVTLKCCNSKATDTSVGNYRNTLIDISSIWETALAHKTTPEQLRYAARIIVECCKHDTKESTSVVVLASGLLLHLFTQLNSSLGNEQDSSVEDFFTKLSNMIYSLNNTLSEYLGSETESVASANNNISNVQQYTRTFYAVLVWTKVQEGILRITTDVLALDVSAELGVFYSVLLETVCATMSLTTQKEYEEKKNVIKYVSNKLGLLPKGDAVNAS